MTKLTGAEIRKKYIEFFKNKHDHLHYPSSSLIPDNPTVLLTTAGMLQFVPFFLGYQDPPNPPRITTCQKCARAGGKDSDIENVGRTPRHHTFFEMLGNFSFGDYFKKEIIPWAWDFVTNYLNLDKDRLWITVFETDDEAAQIWESIGVPKERILRKGKKDNFWGPAGASGPCGPCSEIHYDLGEEYACGPNCSITTCECDRFVEIWNLVFTELNQDEDGNQTPLKKKNVDTGMGLERVTMVVNGLTSTFDTDLLQPILQKVCELSGRKYKQEGEKVDTSIRIITDHARCVTFMIADGLTPSNDGRGYVERMILRRALRHGKMLGLELPFLYKIVDTVVDNYKDTYPELAQNRDKIIETIKTEEERFKLTLDKGEVLLAQVIEETKKSGSTVISGKNAFKLYDTFGFPFELTVEIAQDNGLTVDEEGFKNEMNEQKERAKNAHVKISLTQNLIYVDIKKKNGETKFLGYEKDVEDGCKVVAIVKDNDLVEKGELGDEVNIVLDKTTFYGEGGGQVGDTGVIVADGIEAQVIDTLKLDNLYIHKAKILQGNLNVGDIVTAKVTSDRKKQIRAHHSLAHLLQAALLQVVGSQVAQAGSQVEENRTRFDFTFDRGLTKEEIKQVEKIVNEQIRAAIDCHTTVMSIDDAKNSGAIALFDEKYGDNVRVVEIGSISKELCGGLHVSNTGDIVFAKVLSESAISAGVRRIEAICANAALEYLNEHNDILDRVTKNLKVTPNELEERLDKIVEESRNAQKRVKELENKVAASKMDELVKDAVDTSFGKVLVARADGFNGEILKNSAEKFSSKLGSGVVALASFDGEKISIIVKVSDDVVAKGVKAGEIVNKIATACDGKGGGRPNFAQGGAKNPANLDNILAEIKTELTK
ncbi:MAG: alanine--tRNA ligase [bacterium]|nr:alanine--tRNA ligase [bacterium]